MYAYVGASLVVALAVVALASAPRAQAAEVNILVGSDLKVGSTGQSVVVLQGLLSEIGYLNVPFGIPLGYYGEMTRGAVARYQAARGVSPTAGYFGPVTKTAMHADFALHGWLPLLAW